MATSVKHSHDDTTAKPLINNQTETLKPQKPNSKAAAQTISPETTHQPDT